MTPIFYQIGVRSVPVVAITGIFIGMVLAMQMYGEFVRYFPQAKGWMGVAINSSVVRELGPVLAATMLAGRVGSAMAAELGTMRVTEQIDALGCLGANPMHYLVVPRFLACVLLIPLLTVMADFMGVMGGALLSMHYFGVESYHYWRQSQQKLGMWDVFTGLVKSRVFGAAIALISCHRGFHSEAGAEGVGRAATEAFVRRLSSSWCSTSSWPCSSTRCTCVSGRCNGAAGTASCPSLTAPPPLTRLSAWRRRHAFRPPVLRASTSRSRAARPSASSARAAAARRCCSS